MTTWMLVEDEPDLYDMVLAMYSMIGVKGEAFPDGESAMEWIEKVDAGKVSTELPELGLIDIRLPGDYSGVDVGERLRKSPKLKDMVIVLITGYHISPQVEQTFIRQTQADMFIYKPLPGFAQFRQQLEDLLQKRGKTITEQQPEARPSANGSKADEKSAASEAPPDVIDTLLSSLAKGGNDPASLSDMMNTFGHTEDDDSLEYLDDDDDLDDDDHRR